MLQFGRYTQMLTSISTATAVRDCCNRNSYSAERESMQQEYAHESLPDTISSRKDRRTLFKDPVTSAVFWIRVILGGTFVYASLDKIHHPMAFAQVINNYQILPDAFINLTAIILPWVELILGFLLIFRLWLPGAAVLANLLLITFFSALAFNAARGLNVHCGCFGGSGGENLSIAWYLLRDSVFLLLGISLFTLVCRKKQASSAQ